MTRALKLYIWEGVLTDYTPGIAFALAPDIATARRLIIEAHGKGEFFRKELAERPKVYRKPVGRFLYGGG